MVQLIRVAWLAVMLAAMTIPVSSVRGNNPYLLSADPSLVGNPAGPSTSPPPPPAALGESSVWPVPSPPPSGDLGLVPQPQSQPAFAPPQQQFPMPVEERFRESAWYTRVDYFHWNERLDGTDFVNEYGTLITLGYQRTIGFERFRGEVFGGTMRYLGGAQFEDGTVEPFTSTTGYIGLRGEYDLLFEPTWWQETTLFLGIGTRFWFRDLPGGTTSFGDPVMGYQETWWTFYPYIGLEKRRALQNKFEFYSSAKVGITPFTYAHNTWNDVALYPTTGFMGQAEFGFRGRSAFISAFFEVMTWSESNVVRDTLQPASSMVTIGMRSGFNF